MSCAVWPQVISELYFRVLLRTFWTLALTNARLTSRYPRTVHGICHVLLGLFVLWQLGFTILANAVSIVARPMFGGPCGGALAVADSVQTDWAGLTGQEQHWAMFSPYVATQSAFATVDAGWTDGQTQQLRAAVEPADPLNYFRHFGDFRLQTYETKLCKAFIVWDRTAIAREPREWQAHLVDNFRKHRDAMSAYLAWRLRELNDAVPPAEATLAVRLFRARRPGEGDGLWDAPVEVAIARQRFDRNRQATGPLEMFDPIAGGYTVPARQEGDHD